jgi:hypothetical protein
MTASTDYIPLGSAPANEDCADIGMRGYAAAARKECLAYIEAIRRKLGPEPRGASLAVKPFPCDSGSYYEVVCRFDNAFPAAAAYALRCEREAPESWAEVGMKPPLTPGRPAPDR